MTTTYPSFLRRLGLRNAIQYGDYCRFAEVRLIVEALRGSNPQRTLDYGDESRASIREFFQRAHAAGLLPEPVELEFVDG